MESGIFTEAATVGRVQRLDFYFSVCVGLHNRQGNEKRERRESARNRLTDLAVAFFFSMHRECESPWIAECERLQFVKSVVAGT